MTKLIKKLYNDKDYEFFFEKKFFRWYPQHGSAHIWQKHATAFGYGKTDYNTCGKNKKRCLAVARHLC